ncbi:conserved hypothetical protein [gamma proteobacterium HdN1]|nr:conserved hypothetical protein [gamma proteobacterium HdN1]
MYIRLFAQSETNSAIKRKPRVSAAWRWWAFLLGTAFFGVPAAVSAKVQWDFSGFASYGVGRLSDSSLELMNYSGGHWSSRSDSIVALQAIAQVGDRWSVTGQVVGKAFSYDGKSAWTPRLDWLFVSYEATPDLRLRVGRLRAPLFLFSESLEVGYSYPWVRPPLNMYANLLEPFSNINGMDVSLQKPIGDVENEFRMFAGTEKGKYRARKVSLDQSVGFSVQSKWRALTLRYSYDWFRVSIDDPSFVLPRTLYANYAERLNAPIFLEIADTLRLDNKVFQYHSFGAQWEHGAWMVIAEQFSTQGPDRQFSFENDGRYVSLTWQIGNFMPYVTWSDYRSQVQRSINGRIRHSFEAVPAGSEPLLDFLRNATIAGMDDVSVYQRSRALGMRWDFIDNADVKLEFEYFTGMKSTGQMLFDDSKLEPDHVLATTIVFDVVF